MRIDSRKQYRRALLKKGAFLTTILIAVVAGLAAGRDKAGADAAAQGERSFVYVINNPDGPNSISAFARNKETGELTPLGEFATGGRGTGSIIDSQSPLAANADGTLLFAVNAGSNDISVMAVREDGSLEATGVPTPSRGVAPASLASHGDLLYVANKGDATNAPNYVGFRVSSAGQLKRIKRSVRLNIGDDPTHVLFNRDGSILIGIRLGRRQIESFGVRPNGRLRPLAQLTSQRGPFGAGFNPVAADQLIVSDARLPGAASYRIAATGEVAAVSQISNAPERAACWVTLHPDGRRAWVANTGTHSLSLYAVSGNGVLTLAGTHRTIAYGRLPFEIALDRAGRFLYELNTGAGNQNIHVLRVTDEAGGAELEDVGSIRLPANSAPAGLVVIER